MKIIKKNKIINLKNNYFINKDSLKNNLSVKFKDQLIIDKENFKIANIEQKFEIKKLKKDTNNKISLARKNSILISKKLKEEKIYLNSLYEPVKFVEQEDSQEQFQKYYKAVNTEERNNSYGKKILLLQNKLNALLKKKMSFEIASEIIVATHKIENYFKILELHNIYDEKISFLRKKMEKIGRSSNETIKNKQEKIKIFYAEKIKKIKENYQNNTKEAFKNLMKDIKFKQSLSLKSIKMEDPFISAKEELRFTILDKGKQTEKIINVMNSTIDDEMRKIPTASTKGFRWLAAFLSLVFPGLGQFLNKEFWKGLLFLFGGLFNYAVALPTFLGAYGSRHGNGFFGLLDLSPVVLRNDPIFGTIVLDARFRLVEGVIAIILFSFALVIWISAIHDAYKTGFYREFGFRPKNIRDMKRFLQGTGLPLLISLPALVAISFIVVLPLATTLLIAFTNYSVDHQPPGNALSWIGFNNFTNAISGNYSKTFAFVSGWTIIWTFSVTIGTIVIGTVLALILDNPRIKGKSFLSMVYILPWAVPAFATILFFSASFIGAGTSTFYNKFFNSDVVFGQSVFYTRMLMILIQIWLGHSYVFMLVTGIKKGISSDLYEAAQIDGANKVNSFARITMPLILIQVAPLLVGQFIFNFNNFGLVFLFSGGGPVGPAGLPGNPGSTDLIISLIFNLTTASQNQIGLASAFTVIMSIFIVAISSLIFVRSKAFKKEGV